MEKQFYIGPRAVDRETFYKEATARGLLPKLKEKQVYRHVWEFGKTPDGAHFQRAVVHPIGDEPGAVFMALRVDKQTRTP